MNREDAKKHLRMLGQELQKKEITGEILVGDGVVVLLDIGEPPHVDVDVYMAYLKGEIPEPESVKQRKYISGYFHGGGTAVLEAVASIASCENLPGDWLNQALKELFYTQPPHAKWLEYPGLRVYIPPPRYMLAMKVAISGCPQDIEDIKTLVEKLPISNAQEMFAIITKYIPEELLTTRMRSLVEQLFEPSPPLDYLLALKLLAHRSKDDADITALKNLLGVKKQEEALSLLEKYVSKKYITNEVVEKIEEFFEH